MTVLYFRQIRSEVFLEECQRVVAQMFPLLETFKDGDLVRHTTPFGAKIYMVRKAEKKWLWIFKRNIYTFSKTPILEVLVHKDMKPAKNLKPEFVEFTIKVTHASEIKTDAQILAGALNKALRHKLRVDWKNIKIKIKVLCTETV